MNLNLFVVFCILNIVNVVIQTIKSLATITCGKWVAAIINAIAYGLYTVVVVYTMCDLPLWLKVIVVMIANLIGVLFSKTIFNKMQKEKLWKIEVTIPKEQLGQMLIECEYYDFSYNYVDINKYAIFNFYCPTQKDSTNIKELLKNYNAKYFVGESKTL